MILEIYNLKFCKGMNVLRFSFRKFSVPSKNNMIVKISEAKQSNIFYYVKYPFRMWETMAIHNFLSSIALEFFVPLISQSMFGHLRKFIWWVIQQHFVDPDDNIIPAQHMENLKMRVSCTNCLEHLKHCLHIFINVCGITVFTIT